VSEAPGFDPYAVLGVAFDADPVVVQLAYRARIRAAHPDVAGAAGLEQAKRLNVARDWLLDPARRANLAPSWNVPQQPQARAGDTKRPLWGAPGSAGHAASHAAYDRSGLDPFTFDFGPGSEELRALLASIQTLTRDERARVNYSLGDSRPVVFERYRDYIDPRLWMRSRALRDAVSLVWAQGSDEAPPFIFPIGSLVPTGFLVANAHAQWILLGDFFRQELGDAVFRSEHVIEGLAARCADPWLGSIRQPRYGPYGERVAAFLRAAASLRPDAASRLAHSWLLHLGRDAMGRPAEHIGPGVWLPAPTNYPEALKISGFLAAVDASRIEPPAGLDGPLYSGFKYGLRLSAHVYGLGLAGAAASDYLRPWHDAVGPAAYADRPI
jgi:hypothetical protein